MKGACVLCIAAALFFMTPPKGYGQVEGAGPDVPESPMLTNAMYLRIAAGYGLPIASENLYDVGFYTSSATAKTQDMMNVSLGKGLYIDAAFGENVTPNLALELGFSYLAGTSTSVSQESGGVTDNIYLTGTMYRFMPALVLKTKVEDVEVYSRMAAIIGVPSFTSEDEATAPYYGTLATAKWRFNGGVAVGLHAALGINFSIRKGIDLYTELNVNSISFAPQHGKLYEATIGGVSILDSIPLHQKQIDFKKEISTTPTANDQPDEELIRKFPFSSIGLMIGLRFDL